MLFDDYSHGPASCRYIEHTSRDSTRARLNNDARGMGKQHCWPSDRSGNRACVLAAKSSSSSKIDKLPWARTELQGAEEAPKPASLLFGEDHVQYARPSYCSHVGNSLSRRMKKEDS